MNPTLSIPANPSAELAVYLRHYPEEANRMAPLRDQLGVAGPSILRRTTRPGHIVASGLVLDRNTQKLLVIHHRLLLARIPPGGHYEESGSLRAAAAREIEEETGYVGAKPLALPTTGSSLVDIFPHETPGNPGKGEEPHWHYDFMYLFHGDSSRTLVPQLEEVAEAVWAPVTEYFQSSERGALIGRKLRALLS